MEQILVLGPHLPALRLLTHCLSAQVVVAVEMVEQVVAVVR
jgi:hypothetical protein